MAGLDQSAGAEAAESAVDEDALRAERDLLAARERRLLRWSWRSQMAMLPLMVLIAYGFGDLLVHPPGATPPSFEHMLRGESRLYPWDGLALGALGLALALQALWAVQRRALSRRRAALDALLIEADDRPIVLLAPSVFLDSALAASSSWPPHGASLGWRLQESAFARLRGAIAPDYEAQRFGDRRFWDADAGAAAYGAERMAMFERLAARARAIVLSPILIGEGGAFEALKRILGSELRAKTLLVAPGRGALWMRPRAGFGFIARFSALWARSRAILKARLGVALPPMPRRSALFAPVGDRFLIVRGVSGLPWRHPTALRRLIVENRLSRGAWTEALSFAARFTLLYALAGGFLLLMLGVALADHARLDPRLVALLLLGLALILQMSVWRYCGRFALRPLGRQALLIASWTALAAGVFGAYHIGARLADHLGLADDSPMAASLVFGAYALSVVSASLLGALLIFALFGPPRRWLDAD